MTFRERVERLAQDDAQRMLAPYLAAMEGGDWRASESLQRMVDRWQERDEDRERMTPTGLLGALATLSPAEKQALRERALRELATLPDAPVEDAEYAELEPGPMSQSEGNGASAH